MATPSSVTDKQRRTLEAAIALALLHTYRRHTTKALKRLGIDRSTDPSVEAQVSLQQFSHDRAQLVQAGINKRLDAALANLPDDATDEDKRQAVDQAKREIDRYHSRVLIPFLASHAAHQALIDTYRSERDPEDPSQSAADATLWIWTQNSDYQDECTDAAGAGPAPLSDLLSLAGGSPPLHPRCACELSPAD